MFIGVAAGFIGAPARLLRYSRADSRGVVIRRSRHWTVCTERCCTFDASPGESLSIVAPSGCMKDRPVRPNIIFIVADDLGAFDLGCFGADADVSPNLDRLAREGMRFTRAYSNSPVCSPARFALITGRWQYRLRGALDEPLGRRSNVLGLPPEHPTLPSLLRAAGWDTALTGKWHQIGRAHV